MGPSQGGSTGDRNETSGSHSTIAPFPSAGVFVLWYALSTHAVHVESPGALPHPVGGCSVAQSCWTLDDLDLTVAHTGILIHDSPGKNAGGVAIPSLPGIFPTLGWKLPLGISFIREADSL